MQPGQPFALGLRYYAFRIQVVRVGGDASHGHALRPCPGDPLQQTDPVAEGHEFRLPVQKPGQGAAQSRVDSGGTSSIVTHTGSCVGGDGGCR